MSLRFTYVIWFTNCLCLFVALIYMCRFCYFLAYALHLPRQLLDGVDAAGLLRLQLPDLRLGPLAVPPQVLWVALLV